MQEEIKNLNSPVPNKEVNFLFRNFPTRKSPGQMASQVNSPGI